MYKKLLIVFGFLVVVSGHSFANDAQSVVEEFFADISISEEAAPVHVFEEAAERSPEAIQAAKEEKEREERAAERPSTAGLGLGVPGAASSGSGPALGGPTQLFGSGSPAQDVAGAFGAGRRVEPASEASDNVFGIGTRVDDEFAFGPGGNNQGPSSVYDCAPGNLSGAKNCGGLNEAIEQGTTALKREIQSLRNTENELSALESQISTIQSERSKLQNMNQNATAQLSIGTKVYSGRVSDIVQSLGESLSNLNSEKTNLENRRTQQRAKLDQAAEPILKLQNIGNANDQRLIQAFQNKIRQVLANAKTNAKEADVSALETQSFQDLMPVTDQTGAIVASITGSRLPNNFAGGATGATSSDLRPGTGSASDLRGGSGNAAAFR